jgi:hypothetical protein
MAPPRKKTETAETVPENTTDSATATGDTAAEEAEKTRPVKTTGIDGVANRAMLAAAEDFADGKLDSAAIRVLGCEVKAIGDDTAMFFSADDKSVYLRMCAVARAAGLGYKSLIWGKARALRTYRKRDSAPATETAAEPSAAAS